jgi:hypothetical protein
MSPKPVRPPTPEVQRAALQRLLRRDLSTPRTRLEVRLTAPPPTPQQLAALGLDEPATRLVEAVAKRQGELARRAATDRTFAQQLASDPAAALEAAGVPRATIAAAEITPASALSDRIRDLLIRVHDEDAAGTTASSTAAVDLLAATFADARGNAAKQAELRTNPRPQVLAAAAAHPPAGVAAGSPALASLVIDVTNALLRGAAAAPVSSNSGSQYPTGEGEVATATTLIDIPIAGGH